MAMSNWLDHFYFDIVFSVFFPQLYLHNLITVLAVCVTQAQCELFHDSYCISVHLLLFVLSELSIVLSVSYIELHDIAYIVFSVQ